MKKLIKTPLTKENESAIICKLSTRQRAVNEERTRAGLRTAGWMSESGEQHDKMSRQNITKKVKKLLKNLLTNGKRCDIMSNTSAGLARGCEKNLKKIQKTF